MNAEHGDWRPISLHGRSLQPATDRVWDCQPAWDVDALYDRPDATIALPEDQMWEEREGRRHKIEPVGVFWNRHVDPRFHLSYPKARREAPRFVGRTIGDATREWDLLVRERDRILRAAGIDANAPREAVARALADSFACDLFEQKPVCTTFAYEPRALNQALEGLLHRSHCVGCAMAYEALVDSLGFEVRTIGCGAHRVAEVRVGHRWHMVDSVARHRENRGLDCFFASSYHDCVLEPSGNHGEHLPPPYRRGLLRRVNPQYHFHDGMWGGPRTLRWAASCAKALYPDQDRWGVKGERETPILKRAGGFYWPSVHSSDQSAFERLRRESLPDPVSLRAPSRDYLFYALRKGEAVRESLWLGDLSDCRGIRVTLTFGWSKQTDFGPKTGAGLALRINGVERSLLEWKAWPPRDGGVALPEIAEPSGEMARCSLDLPSALFESNRVNWISLLHSAEGVVYLPCLPAILEPHLPALGSLHAARALKASSNPQ